MIAVLVLFTVIRAMTTPEGGFADLALNPFDKLFLPGKAGEIVNGAVDHVEDGEVHLADGRVLPYDWLVLATGTTWDGPLNLPLDREDARKWVAEWHEKFAKARSIVVLGAGAAGIGEQLDASLMELDAWASKLIIVMLFPSTRIHRRDTTVPTRQEGYPSPQSGRPIKQRVPVQIQGQSFGCGQGERSKRHPQRPRRPTRRRIVYVCNHEEGRRD